MINTKEILRFCNWWIGKCKDNEFDESYKSFQDKNGGIVKVVVSDENHMCEIINLEDIIHIKDNYKAVGFVRSSEIFTNTK
jgi:hypothetical protein